MLGLKGMLMGQIALVVPVASEVVTIRTKLDFFFCQPRRGAVVCF